MISFILLGLMVVAGAAAAVSLRNLVHCALCMTLSFAGLAGIYLQLQAEFVAFTQVLVYLGAIAILILFAILLTGGAEPPKEPATSKGFGAGLAVTAAFFGIFVWAVWKSGSASGRVAQAVSPTVRRIGEELMSRYILVLEIVGVALTVAIIGAVILAQARRKDS